MLFVEALEMLGKERDEVKDTFPLEAFEVDIYHQ
jgi:hypothetical protein